MTQVDMSLAYALTSAIGIVVIPEITVIDYLISLNYNQS